VGVLELWDVADAKVTEDKKNTACKEKDQLALWSIALSLEQELIYHCETDKSAWDKLKEIYEGKGTHRLLSLLKSLDTVPTIGELFFDEGIYSRC
jgi:gag-polypeptide of LTR copia-type